MKPRLTREGNWWVCRGYGIIGAGDTQADAFQMWREMLWPGMLPSLIF